MEISEENLQTIEKYALFQHLIDSNGIVDESVLEKLKLNIRSLITSEEGNNKELLDLCIDVIYHNNMKAFGLHQLILLYIRWEKEKNQDGQRETSDEQEKETETYQEILDINHEKVYEDLHLSTAAEHTRAYIKVQDGCNQFCSYCIIPFARGRVRSRSRDSVLDEVKTLSANGYKEVVLTGIHLSSYGIDCDDNLLSLILAIHEVEGIERIRLGSLEPRIITEEFAQTIAKLPKMCPHFHLSLQSGCNATLKRMNRRYTAEEYYEKCQLLRKYFDNPALTTDVIVGFPGETEEEFAESKAFVDKVDFYETHIFKYSRREGTKAAAMKDQVPDQIKAARSAELLELNRKKQAVYEERTTQEVLIEEKIVRDGEELQIGHTKEYVKIGVKNPNNLINQLVNVEIENQLQILH